MLSIPHRKGKFLGDTMELFANLTVCVYSI